MRYGGWRRLRGNSDRPDLLDLGKKLLGYLAEQRRLSGVPTQAIQRRAPDGSLVRARWVVDLPILEIQAAPARPDLPPGLLYLEGFIVRPSDAGNQLANVDLDHVVLVPTEAGFKPVFYDAAHTPGGYDPKHYGVAHLFPEGLLRSGNVDWRNADETMMLTWYGPSGRYYGYFFDTHAADALVFCKGRVLWDAADHGTPREDFPEDLDVYDTVVRGACLRYDGGLWLYLALRSQDWSAYDDDYVVRYKVRSVAQAAEARARWPELRIREHLFPDLEVVRGSGEQLLRSPALHYPDGPHPWCFNSDGTEARRIYWKAGTAYECILLDTDGTWSIARNAIASLTKTTSTTRTRTLGSAGSYAIVSQHDDYSFSDTRDHPWLVDQVNNEPVDGNLKVATSATIDHAETPSATWVRSAVDFWDGEWRYAESALFSTSLHSERSVTPGVDSSVEDYFYTDGGVLYDWTSTQVTIDFSATASKTDVYGKDGLRTDFLEVRAIGSLSYNGTLTYDFEIDSLDNVSSGPGPIGQSGTFSQSGTLARETVDVQAALEIHFLDLRFGTAYYSTWQQTTTSTQAGALSVAESWSPPDAVPALAAVMPTTLEQATASTWTTTLVSGGAVVDSYTDTTNSGSGPNPSTDIPLAQMHDRLREVVTGTDGSTAGVALFTAMGFSSDTWHDHRAYGAAPTSSNTGPTVASDPSTPIFDSDINGTLDFYDSPQWAPGAWQTVKGRFLYSQENHPDRPAGEPLWRFGSSQPAHGLDTLLAAYPGAVRFHPVGYLPRTVAVR